MQHFFHNIGKAIITGAIAIAGLFGVHQAPVQAPSPSVGATVPVVVATFQTSLQAGISSSATSMTLVSATDKAGNSLSGYTCFNLDEGTSKEEFVCGTASGVSVTSMIRGISPTDGDLEVTALKKAHARGASMKVTNYPSIAILSRILNGNESIPNPIGYTTGIGPIASGDLADKEYVLSVVSGGSVTFEKVVQAGTAGETLAAGNLVYLKASDGRWWLTDADTASTVENVILGVAQGAGTAGNAITTGVLVSGIDTNQTGLSANTIYYASNTAGGLSNTAGTKEVTIGIATNSTTLIFNPKYNQTLTEDEQDALAGGSTFGTPSTTNKFITQSYNSSATGLPVVRTYLNAGSPATWTKPAGLKYVIVEVQAGGGAGSAGVDAGATGQGGAGGGGGGYSRKMIPVASLGATETVTTGAATASSSFGSRATATGGSDASGIVGGTAGIGSSGDLNLEGGDGNGAGVNGLESNTAGGGIGGSSRLGGGGKGSANTAVGGADGNLYGGGGGGGAGSSSAGSAGGVGAVGIVTVTEYYN